MPHAVDLTHLRRCLTLASAAARRGEVPVGALVVGPLGAPLCGASNRNRMLRDALAHAELLALRASARLLRARRLDGCTLYCSLEPCLMCLGAALGHHVSRVVFAARSEKFGAVTSGGARAVPVEGAAAGAPCAACAGAGTLPPRALRASTRTLLLECAEDAPCLRPAAEASARLLRVFFGGLRAARRELGVGGARCGRCGAAFDCGAAADGAGGCWCAHASLPRALVPRAGAGAVCLCPACLSGALQGREEESATTC
jgi:tRNA(adenine34) deaminase